MLISDVGNESHSWSDVACSRGCLLWYGFDEMGLPFSDHVADVSFSTARATDIDDLKCNVCCQEPFRKWGWEGKQAHVRPQMAGAHLASQSAARQRAALNSLKSTASVLRKLAAPADRFRQAEPLAD